MGGVWVGYGLGYGCCMGCVWWCMGWVWYGCGYGMGVVWWSMGGEWCGMGVLWVFKTCVRIRGIERTFNRHRMTRETEYFFVLQKCTRMTGNPTPERHLKFPSSIFHIPKLSMVWEYGIWVLNMEYGFGI